MFVFSHATRQSEKQDKTPSIVSANSFDMNVETPDKKSVMTYLMCLFQELPHSIVVCPNNNSTTTPTSVVAEATVSPASFRSPVSGAIDTDACAVTYREKPLDVSEASRRRSPLSGVYLQRKESRSIVVVVVVVVVIIIVVAAAAEK
ncbi:dystrophin-like isoform X6 [Elysia marginata]|uniref:Dystrophin-like isoform X6 n=1 Tax=Elysia marginata TaxID=1093978 RepID=A0AAV4ETK1_9GAST|nr:dystrophin-like isoform X6 [Elysia marginata]